MPIYEYRCGKCGVEFEKLVGARTVVACPSCEASQVTRKLSLFGARVHAPAAGPGPAMPGGGGCCGGGCACR